MNDFIAKPLDVEQLIATLLRYLPDVVLPLTSDDEPLPMSRWPASISIPDCATGVKPRSILNTCGVFAMTT